MKAFISSPRGQMWLWAAVVLGLVLFATALSTLMLPYSRIVEERSAQDLTCLQIPFTQARAASIVESYDAEANAAARTLHFPGDTLFPIGYALLYSGLIGLVARRQPEAWLRFGLWAMLFPVVAMVFDWTENFFIVQMLTIGADQGSAAIPAWMPLVGGIAGSLKYLSLSVLTPAYGLAAIGRSFITRRPPLTAGAVVTYVIVAGLLLFNLSQLFTGVLPCLGGI